MLSTRRRYEQLREESGEEGQQLRVQRARRIAALALIGLLLLSLLQPASLLFLSPWLQLNAMQPVQHRDEQFEDWVHCSLPEREIIFLDDIADFATSAPSSYPSSQPSSTPTLSPSSPTSIPSSTPTSPSSSPVVKPTGLPSSQPTSFPSSPSCSPSCDPSGFPSSVPSISPSSPSMSPSCSPTSPSSTPVAHPTYIPSCKPTAGPSSPTISPSHSPSYLSRMPSTSSPLPSSYPTNNYNSTSYNTTAPSEFSIESRDSSRKLQDEDDENDDDDQELSERFRVLPIRASLFPPPKEIYLNGLSDNSNQLAILSLSSQLKIFLKGVHRTFRPHIYSIIRAEISRFCSSSESRSLSTPHHDMNSPPLMTLQNITIDLLDLNTSLSVNSSDYKQSLLFEKSDEGYHLSIFSSHSYLKAYSVEGLMYGFKTLSQLCDTPRLLPLPFEIIDWPIHPWRGILIDAARHFFPLSSIRRTIDAMHIVKLNTLHLHLSDAQAFPIQLKDVGDLKMSLLTNERSYLRTSDEDDDVPSIDETHINDNKQGKEVSHNETLLYSYTLEDLSHLVQYASRRGIKVIPEIDMPAHTFSWAKKIPEILVNCTHAVNYDLASYTKRPTPQIDIYILNPTKAMTLKVVKEMLKQLVDVFPSPYMHIGGDEVMLKCWEEDDELIAWVESHNSTLHEVFKDFEMKIFDTVRDLGKIPISWQGLLDMNVLPDTPVHDVSHNISENSISATSPSVLMPWKCWGGLAGHASSLGKADNHPIVTSACWYLDFDSEWNDFLRVDPVNEAMSAPVPTMSPSTTSSSSYSPSSDFSKSKPHLVWGGEASMWTEHVDATNLDCRIWPRGGAIASSLWGLDSASREVLTPMGTGSISDVERKYASASGKAMVQSYIRHRYFLFSRGIEASSLTFHEVDSSASSGYYRSYLPQSFASELDAYRYVDNQNTVPISGYKRFDIGSIRMTSQCPIIDKDVFRPLRKPDLVHKISELVESRSSSRRAKRQYNVYKVVQINVADGFPGDRRSLMTSWLKRKANEGVDIVGMCELNHWHTLESRSQLQKNFPMFRSYAASVGFVHSHILHSDLHPYNIGIMAAMPFEVISEFKPPLFERGALHVFFRHNHLHVLVVHLNAHDSLKRENETSYLASVLSPLLSTGEKVILMGDLNSLSPLDRELHIEEELVSQLSKPQESHWSPNFALKLLNETGGINYKPLDTLLQSGMYDSCAVICERINFPEVPTWTVAYSKLHTKNVSSCMRKLCGGSEPTLYNPEWSNSYPQPKLRLDFMLVSPSLIHSSATQTGVTKSLNSYDMIIAAGVEVNNQTLYLSDHFPIYFHWREK